MPLSSVLTDITRRKHEADTLINTVKQQELIVGNAQTCAMIKSAIILVLYNAVESTMHSALEILHEKCQSKNFTDLTDKQKHIFVSMYFRGSDIKKSKENIDSILLNALKFPGFREFKAAENLFSGNLDGLKINNILSKYGIAYSVAKKYREPLLFTKNMRNKLAHGESSFSTACRNIVISNIAIISDDVFNALENIVSAINHHASSIV